MVPEEKDHGGPDHYSTNGQTKHPEILTTTKGSSATVPDTPDTSSYSSITRSIQTDFQFTTIKLPGTISSLIIP